MPSPADQAAAPQAASGPGPDSGEAAERPGEQAGARPGEQMGERAGKQTPSARATVSSRRRTTIAFARALGVIAAVLIIDRLTKHAVVTGIAVGDVQKFLPGVQLVHVRNSGVAFGFFAGGGALVLILTLAALAALVTYFLLRPTRPGLWLPTGLLIGGAIGNLIDRLVNGSVTDFIKLPLWPAFNVSDMAITFGVLALLYVLEGPSSASDDGG
jgi:signal peptidase II